MFSYIVEYAGRNILVQTESKESFIKNLVNEFKKKNISINSESVILNLFNSDLKIYYEVHPEQLPDHTALVKVNDLSCENSAPVTVCDPQTTPVDSVHEMNISKSGPPHFNISSSACPDLHSEEKVIWPNMFKIREQKMSHSLRSTLQRGDLLSRKELGNLLDFLYEEITIYTYYPTPSNYEEVTSALLCKYPHLLEGCNFGDAKEQWRVRLSAKARNSRQRHDKNVFVVAQKRQKLTERSLESGPLNAVKKATPAFGSPNYMPNKPDTEDHDSVMRHISFLKAEIKKSSIDTRKIEISMKSTFYHRRNLLINEGYTLIHLKEIYPVLYDAVQIMYEFLRITEVDIETSLRVRLAEYADSILKVSGVVFEELEDDYDITERKICLAAEQIPKLLKDSVSFNKKSEIASPMIYFLGDASLPNSSGALFAEGIEVCKFNGLITGLSVWLAAYYTFDCSYPPSCCRTLRFLQREILGIKDKSKVSLISSKLIQRLNILKQKEN